MLCQSNTRKHIKGTIYSLSFQYTKFECIKVVLKRLKTCTYLRKWLHASSLSKKKQKQKRNKGYMPCCPSFNTCSVFGSTRSSFENFRKIKNEYNLVNDHIMQVLGWLVQNRKRSFNLKVTLNVDNIQYNTQVGIQYRTTQCIINQTHT